LSVTGEPVPEPGSLSLLGLGGLAVWLGRRHRRRMGRGGEPSPT
jgi:hypothetical protein